MLFFQINYAYPIKSDATHEDATKKLEENSEQNDLKFTEDDESRVIIELFECLSDKTFQRLYCTCTLAAELLEKEKKRPEVNFCARRFLELLNGCAKIKNTQPSSDQDSVLEDEIRYKINKQINDVDCDDKTENQYTNNDIDCLIMQLFNESNSSEIMNYIQCQPKQI